MGSKRSLTLLGWRVVVFLCLHVFAALSVGGGCGCVFGLGMKCLIADEHTVGFTFNTVLASAARVGGGCPHNQPEGGCPFGCGLCVVGCL